MIFCLVGLRDFCVWRGCVNFCEERLHDIFFGEVALFFIEVAWFWWCRCCVIFFGSGVIFFAEILCDFFVWRGCVLLIG